MSVTLFDGVSVTVEAGFGYAPLNTSPVWTDISEWVRDIKIDRGRRSEFTDYGVGDAHVKLDNRDRRFDPEYTSSPYYGDLNPMVPIRIQATYSGTTYTMFYGFVQGWPTAYEVSNVDAVTTLKCVDGNRLLNSMLLPQDPFTDYMNTVTKNTVYFPLQDRNETYVEPLTIVEQLQPSSVDAGAIGFVSLVEGETVNDFNSTPAFVEFWVGRTSGRPVNVQVVALGAESTSPSYRTLIDVDIVDDDIRVGVGTPFDSRTTSSTGEVLDKTRTLNHVVVTQKTLSVYELYLNGSLAQTLTLSSGTFSGSKTGGNPFTINTVKTSFDGKLAHVAGGYGTALTAAEIAEHYDYGANGWAESSSARLTRALDDAGWPNTWRDIETGVQHVGAYYPEAVSARDYMTNIRDAEQGLLFLNREGGVELLSRSTVDSVNIVGLFDDEGIDLPFTSVTVDAHTVEAIRNNVVVNYSGGRVTATDSGSVTAYGEVTQRLRLGLVDDESDAQQIADSLLARSKDPRTRIKSLEVNMRRDVAGVVPTVAALELGDNVAVSLTPTGVGDPLWRAVTVQGIKHTIGRDRWMVNLYLEPSAIGTNGALLVLDDDTYGRLDEGNRLG